jgi:hypothetical protein
MPNNREQAMDLLRQYPFDVLGSAEIAKVLGITSQAVSGRVSRGVLIPTVHLAMGPVWTKDDVRDYLLRPRDKV